MTLPCTTCTDKIKCEYKYNAYRENIDLKPVFRVCFLVEFCDMLADYIYWEDKNLLELAKLHSDNPRCKIVSKFFKKKTSLSM